MSLITNAQVDQIQIQSKCDEILRWMCVLVTENGSSSKSKGVIIGIAVGCGVLVVALAGAAAYAFVQRRRAQKAKEELGGPFGT